MANKMHHIDNEWHQEKSGDPTKTHCDKDTASAKSPEELTRNRMALQVAICATCKAAYVA